MYPGGGTRISRKGITKITFQPRKATASPITRARIRGTTARPIPSFLDLEAPLPDNMRGICDLAWTHTVPEHVGDVETAFRNLGALTRDAVLVVVPWIQDEHYAPGLYGDFWRFAPLGSSI